MRWGGEPIGRRTPGSATRGGDRIQPPAVAGHALVEVVVALLLLELGVLSIVGSTVLADRISQRALEMERAAGTAEVVADSLLAEGYSGAGSRETPWGSVRWGPGERAPVAVEVMPGKGAGGSVADSLAILTVLLAPPGTGGGS